MGNRGREGQVAPLRARASGVFPGGHSAENPPALQTGCPFPRLTAAVGPVSTRENRGLVVTVTLTRRSVQRRAGRLHGPLHPPPPPRPRRATGPANPPRPPGPARRGACVHTRAHAHRRKAGPRPLPGEGRALAGPPGAFRPLPACAAISSPGRGRLPPLPGCKWPAPGTACPLRRPCSAWPGSECGWPGRGPAFPRQQPGTQVACPPTVCFGGPWLGRTTRPSGWWSSWPRSDRGLRGPRGNDAGGHPQSDPWPPNTGPPLGPPPQQGDAKHLCICVHGAHAAARPPRGHASPHSAHAERAWALEDVRPGFESHPNPHDPVRTRSASEPGASAAGRRGARPALQALLGLGRQSPSLRGVRSVTCATTRQGHLLSPLSR